MTDIRISFFTGDYKYRQLEANRANIDLYVEYHFNYYSRITNYTLTKVPSDPKSLSLAFARQHGQLVHQYMGIPLYDKESSPADAGILVCKKNSQDAYNFSLISAPAVLPQPLFLSNDAHVAIAITEQGTDLLAAILVETLRTVLPNGGHVGFSVGHKYQRSAPADRGSAAVCYPEFTEADIADTVLNKAAMSLRAELPVVLHTLHVPQTQTHGQVKSEQAAA